MSENRAFAQWRDENRTTLYPFSPEATLTNGTQTLLEGSLIDANLFPIGGDESLYLSSVTVTYQTVTITIGTNANAAIASGSFPLLSPPTSVALSDQFGRPAGLLVSEGVQLGLFGAWGVGTFKFKQAQTAFAATVCVPVPDVGVRGIQLPDGSLLSGEVWLVGDDGVVLSSSQITTAAAACGAAEQTYTLVRVDVVGDPLFKRRLCSPSSLFATPRFLQSITFKDSRQSVKVLPDERGDVKITVNNNLSPDTALRVHPTAAGTQFDVVGTTTQGP